MSTNSWVNPFYQTHKDLRDSVMKTYGEQVAEGNKGLQTGSNFLKNDYQNSIDQLNLGLKDATSQLSNSSASKGSFGSTAWQEQQNSLANKYNLQSANQFDTSKYKSDTLGLKYQPDLGQDVQSMTPQFGNYQSSPTGQVSQGSQSYRYNPFQQTGSGFNNTKVLNLNKINY